jgi:hypothetical protein
MIAMTDDVVEMTLRFEETPVGPADIRERCEAIADRMAELEAERSDQDDPSEQPVATDGGVATADGGAEADLEDMPEPSRHDGRIDRALSTPMAIEKLAPGLFEVQSIGSDGYRTDPSLGACTCPDAENNLGEYDVCKHVLAVVARRGPDVLDGGNR